MTRSLLAFALLVGTSTSLAAQTPLRLADSTVIRVTAPRQVNMSSIPQHWRDSVAVGWASNFTGGSYRPDIPLTPGRLAVLSLQILRSGNLRRVRVITSSGDPGFDSVLVATTWAADRALAFPKFTHQMEGAGTEISLEIWDSGPPGSASTVPVAASGIPWTLPAEFRAMTPKCDSLLREPTAFPAMTLRARLDSVTGDAARREWAARALTVMQPEFHPTRGFAPELKAPGIMGGATDPRLSEVWISAILRFQVDPTGHLTDAQMVTPTGYPALDSALIAMVNAADSGGAIPPPPPGAATGSVDVVVTTDRGATQVGIPLGVVHLGVWAADQLPVITRPGPMHYPETLRAAGIRGRVTLEFLVGITGEPVPGSVRIVSSPHPEFSSATAQMIYGSRFRPGTARGCPVNVVVQQSVNYNP